jgi:endonuclease/exonuclease/phosphatase family metal-dependent hydrolase
MDKDSDAARKRPIGTTGRGIGITYAEKAERDGLRLADLDWKEKMAEFDGEDLEYLNKYRDQLLKMRVDLTVKMWEFRKDNIPKQIANLVEEKQPDILCIQEYTDLEQTRFSKYKYNQIFREGKNIIVGNAIFSKYKIINKGKITFPDSNNNVVFADILKDRDTLRIYSMHLQSIKISTDIEDEDIQRMDENKTRAILRRISKAFKKQQIQAELIKQHYQDCEYKKIICGDMNNSAFSYVYRTIKGSMEDAFETNGSGFGKTYNFKYYPARIDYILVDKKMQVKEFETLNDFYNSDHFPLLARLNLSKEL